MAAPLGNHNARRGKLFRQALAREIARVGDGNFEKGMDLVAKTLVKNAVAGDNRAAEMVADRFDGKPSQSIEATGANGGPMEFLGGAMTDEQVATRLKQIVDGVAVRQDEPEGDPTLGGPDTGGAPEALPGGEG